MNKTENEKTKKDIQDRVYKLAICIETFFAIVIAIVIVLLAVKLITIIFQPGFFVDEESFSNFLKNALGLVVGVEFVKMLVRHTMDNVVEVLIFAISRHLIVYHLEIWEMLIGVLCIAILFAIRKFLVVSSDEEKHT
ncbi:MAG: phosphate-starvation-inducible PsiE family protein [Frisingicoccus sp.]|uniref:phosphate-starvation-inducible PsiE family protein n=1 Tax=Frisingicoccus sp. TaxID=1918627 RepID=UPI0026055DA4|nr:phosphate-starvation-inducible PsiE family protein [Frisingicoccus sp.]MDD6233245.1 phosphate-starvation-inducible PsiE family protein [Frisingicoccus sp.]